MPACRMQVGEGPERQLDRRVKNQIQRGHPTGRVQILECLPGMEIMLGATGELTPRASPSIVLSMCHRQWMYTVAIWQLSAE